MRALLGVIAAIAALGLATAPAHADANDDSYIQQLNAAELGCGQGPFTCVNGDSDMIAVGHSVCRLMRGGNSQLSVMRELVRVKPGLTPEKAGTLLGIAKTNYCPAQ
jgi:hypothetical protein